MVKRNAILRTPPHDTSLEKALLGALILRPNSIHDIVDSIYPETFYERRNSTIYQTIRELALSGKPIDMVSLVGRMRDQNILDSVGGHAYLIELTESVPASVHIPYYAEQVSKKSTLRNLIESGDYLAQLGFEEHRDLHDILEDAEKRMYAVTHNAFHADKFVSMKDLLPDTIERVEKLSTESGTIRGVPTGYVELDNKLAGLQKSDLIILAARPSMGKTSLALDIARQVAVQSNIPVGLFSLEMSTQQLVDRMVASQGRIDLWKLRTGKGLHDSDFEQIRDAVDVMSRAPIYINDESSMNILAMKSSARKLKAKYGLGLIIVDYLQLITTVKNYDSMVNQVSEISRSLKSLARELDVPVLALSQLSRAVESRGGKPRLSDLRDSGAIEQDADVVMFIHREDKYNEASDRPNIAEILIEKHRNGATGKVELYFDQEKASFLSLEKGAMSGDPSDNGPTYTSLDSF